MTTTPCTGCAVQQGTHQPADALHQIAEPDAISEGEAFQALSELTNALRERHYGRMPSEVQAAYDKAWTIVFAGAKSTPVAQQTPAHPAEAVPAQDWQDAVAEAAQARAAGYEGDDRKDIKTDVFNAFANGADWERRRAAFAAPHPPEVAPVPQFSRIAQKKLDYLLFVHWWQDAAAPQPPACNPSMQPELATFAAPVQLPEPAAWVYSFTHSSATGKPDLRVESITTDRERAFSEGHSDQFALYTEHQVRQLLAAHGIQEQST